MYPFATFHFYKKFCIFKFLLIKKSRYNFFFIKMKSCERVCNVKIQNISSITWKMSSLERLQSILGQLKIPSKPTLMTESRFTSQIHSFSLNYAYGQSLLSIFIALILLNKNLTLLDRIYRTRAVKFISLRDVKSSQNFIK